jgi:predicted lipid carrier protein YhbT
MYKKAAINKLRFETSRGPATVEDLRDIPLITKNGFNLDEVAKTINKQLKECEESFVEKKSTGNEELELKMAIVKDIIADKLQEEADAKNAVARKAKKEKLMGILERKQDAELEGMPAEDIRKMIEEL